jgi:hypothetical protein
LGGGRGGEATAGLGGGELRGGEVDLGVGVDAGVEGDADVDVDGDGDCDVGVVVVDINAVVGACAGEGDTAVAGDPVPCKTLGASSPTPTAATPIPNATSIRAPDVIHAARPDPGTTGTSPVPVETPAAPSRELPSAALTGEAPVGRESTSTCGVGRSPVTATARASAISLADAKRSLGSRAHALENQASMLAGSARFAREGTGSGSRWILSARPPTVSAVNGFSPVSAS